MKKLITLRAVLLLLIATPALADAVTLPVLSGQMGTDGLNVAFTITTALFSGTGADRGVGLARGGSGPPGSLFDYYAFELGGVGHWTYQGVTYNYSNGFDPDHFGISPITFREEAHIMLTLPLGPFEDFSEISGPATVTGQITFNLFTPDPVAFEYTGSGIGKVRVFRIPGEDRVFVGAAATAVFGDLAVPEPSTGLLLGTGLIGLSLWRRKRAA
jgi:hypothetical protein